VIETNECSGDFKEWERAENFGFDHADKRGLRRKLLINLQRHHRMNFPNGVARHVLSSVALIFRSVGDVAKSFANNGEWADCRLLDYCFLRLRNPTYLSGRLLAKMHESNQNPSRCHA
jgi:hypothetical protein